jgi:hypothetical protein
MTIRIIIQELENIWKIYGKKTSWPKRYYSGIYCKTEKNSEKPESG